MAALHFLDKLGVFAPISATTRQAVLKAAERDQRKSRRGEDVISEGQKPRNVHLITDGWACRYKMLEDGRRQLLAVFLPGDLFDPNVYILDRMDHSICALSELSFITIAQREMEQLCDDHPQLARALWWESLVAASIQREWLVNAAQRTPLEALAHMFCELYYRLRLVRLAERGKPIFFPLTQTDIADALGLTQPHVSRLLRQLNSLAIVEWSSHRLVVHDQDSLRRVGGFNPDYLHFR